MKNGFTFIEILLVITIICILSFFSFYSLANSFRTREYTNGVSRLNNVLNFSQMHSINSGLITIICPSSNQKKCDDNNMFSNGWIVFTDNNADYQFSSEDKIILVGNRASNDLSMKFSSANKGRKIIFYPNVRIWPNGSLEICHKKITRASKVIINQSGRIRHENINPQDCLFN